MEKINGNSVALGLFDGVHRGHRAVLSAAAQYQRSGVFTFTPESIPQKHGAPFQYIYPSQQKFALLRDLGMAEIYAPDFATICALDGETFCKNILLEHFHANDVFCGADFRFGKGASCNTDDLRNFGEKFGFSVHCIAPVCCDGEKISSTRIRSAIAAGNMELSADLLGAHYQLLSEVVAGNAIGREHAVPTVNMTFSPRQLVPRYGVYVSRTVTPAGTFDSITNIGVKPTICTDATPVAETNLFQFSGNLYGTICRVELLHFLRDEKKFPSKEALYAQIKQDIERIKHGY